MAKNGKKKVQKKKTGKKSAPKARGMSMGLSHLTMGVCSVTNPFCTEAIGTRWPDNSRTKSLGWGFQNQNQTVGANASGVGAVLFTPSYQNTVYGGAVAGTTVTYAGSGSPMVIPPTTARYRLVTWGLRINSALAKMTATGMCHIRLFSPDTYNFLGTIDLTSTMADAAYDIPISRLIDQDAYVLPMPLGDDARLFWPTESSGTTSALANTQLPGWQVVQVGVSGAPASSVPLNVYAYYHFEIVPQDGDSANAFARAPPPPNPAIQNANAGVLASVGNFFEGAASKLDSVIKSKAARFLAAGVGAWYGGPSGAANGYAIADRGQKMLTVD